MKDLINRTDSVTIGEIVAENYNAAGIFRKYGMDFCCGGGITLSKACQKRNVNADELIHELQKLSEGISDKNENYLASEPEYLIEHIINTHHQFVRYKIEEISVYAEKVARVHGERHPENVEINQTFKELSREMMDHMEDEEKTVFPLISSISTKRKMGEPISPDDVNELTRQLQLMEDDHEGAGNLMAMIRKQSNNFTPPVDACATYRILYQNLRGFEEDLHKHVHLENNVLFKKAEKLVGYKKRV